MKKQLIHLITFLVALAALPALFASCTTGEKHVVVLFTNDTHSNILPAADGRGGIERRKVLIDSLRNCYPDLLLVDAGDMVQGTPYFTIFGGEVEMMTMNALGYDVRTPGNHEFDNGMEALAAMLTAGKAVTVSSNYDLGATPLASHVVTSHICEAGNMRVGFMGLNVQPAGLIDSSLCRGVTYLDPIAVADSMATLLRSRGADVVIALSHLGYCDENNTGEVTDTLLVKRTRNIDLIIGGHSHTLVSPDSAATSFPTPYLCNIEGDTVVVAQTGKYGRYVGCAHITIAPGAKRPTIEYSLFPIDSRYDDRLDPALHAALEPYNKTLDSIMSVVIGKAAVDMNVEKPQSLLTNWAADAFAAIASQRYDKPIDFAVVNTGGVRASFEQGDITRGDIFTAFPFDNVMVVTALKGSDVKDLFATIALRGGEGVSSEVHLVIDNGQVQQLSIAGKPVDDNRIYHIATLDYVANGGDNMKAFTRAVGRTRYPDFVRDMLEAYITGLTAQGRAVVASLDDRITIAN